MDPSDPPIGNSPCPAPWLPSTFYAVTYNNKTYRLRPMLSFFLAHDSAYRRNYAPDFAVWVQGEDFGPWDSALFMEELTEFWFCCEQYSRNYELTRTDSTVLPSVPDTPPLSAPAAPAAAPPPAAPLPVPERVLPRTTRLASTNRFAPLLSLDTDPVVDTSVPEQAVVAPVDGTPAASQHHTRSSEPGYLSPHSR
ncbi:hypothetical protein MKEN_00330200 [Mycena kentingensis (nom. inval.)]|nr:hypothetical protein MKEN_00330200 [Mycena kentingensis (nom. inval.)]